MSVQAPVVDGFPQVFHPDMSMDGMVDTRGGGLLSDDESMLLDIPDFDSAGGYVSDFMSHGLPRIEVDDKSDPLMDMAEPAPEVVGGKSTPSKTGLRSRHRDAHVSSSSDLATSRNLQKCSNCGEGIWQREAAARRAIASASLLLCPACRAAQATKKRRNRSSSRSSSSAVAATAASSTTASSCHDAVGSADEVLPSNPASCGTHSPGQLTAFSEMDGASSMQARLSPVPSLKVEADENANPVNVKSTSSWVPLEGRHCHKPDKETLAAQDCQRFYFESDQLALKNNPDYQLLLRTLVVLKAQRCQALKDRDLLHQTRALALVDPAAFVEDLRNERSKPEIPSAQPVLELPKIDWDHYNSVLASGKNTKMRSTRKAQQQQQQQELDQRHSPAVQSSGGASMDTFTKVMHGAQPVAAASGATILDALRDAQSTHCGVRTSSNSSSGRQPLENKSRSFNQLWSTEEQARLEQLLEKYPTEPIESRRWKKIAAALGNRTPRQVASRVQKYFIKLRKASLPIPGRAPSATCRKGSSSTSSTSSRRGTSSSFDGRQQQQQQQQQRALGGMRTSTFGSSESGVYMDEGDYDDIVPADRTRLNNGGTASSSSQVFMDAEFFEEEVDVDGATDSKGHPMQSKEELFDSSFDIHMQHAGYQCDGCGQEPLCGFRWHCDDCPDEDSLDFCNDCVDQCNVDSGTHLKEHNLRPIRPTSSPLIDRDYTHFGHTSSFFDSNFCPA